MSEPIQTNRRDAISPSDLALRMKELYDAVSPHIERHTAEVCPNCQNVCCIDRHGTYERNDYIYLEALDEPDVNLKPKEVDTEPCRNLGQLGCELKRYQRPYRCTWFFCQALLDEMPRKNMREYRAMMQMLTELGQIRDKLINLAD